MVGFAQNSAESFSQVIVEPPPCPDTPQKRGIAAYKAGRLHEAVQQFEAALVSQPLDGDAHAALGSILCELGQTEAALFHLRGAQMLRPDIVEVHANLGSALTLLGQWSEAAQCYLQALTLRPDMAALHFNLANVLLLLGQHENAERAYRTCLALAPDMTDARYNLAHLLMTLGRLEEARACYHAVLRVRPDMAEAYNNIGIVLQQMNRIGPAVFAFEAARRLRPDSADVHYNLGCAYLAQNRLDDAVECYTACLDMEPGHGAAAFALCRAQLPIVYESEAQIIECRANYAAALDQICADASGNPQQLAQGAGASPPFFLAYGGLNDRDLQMQYGALTSHILAAAHPPAAMPPAPAAGEKIRIGIVSGFFHRHTVWELMLRGWLTQLDRTQFEIFAYYTGSRQDEATELAAALCDHFVRARQGMDQCRAAILHDAPHILLYPEIGMDPGSAELAAQRLAPVQCASWGHPVTSGLPTIDYFLSSAAMEPQDAEQHYSETLVRLPGLGVYVQPTTTIPETLTRAELGVRDSAFLFWSGQALYKYLPQHDCLFPRIAQQVGDCQFLFIGYDRCDSVTQIMRDRLDRAFAAYGLRAADHCVFLPSLPQPRFLGAIALCDAVLDTVGWSGGRSTLEALTTNPALITLAGPLMRGRHSAAMLDMMGIPEAIAANLDDYVSLAVRLGVDPAFHNALRQKIAARKYRLFHDSAVTDALEGFLRASIHKLDHE